MSARPPVPLAQAVLGLSIFATIALPLAPDGTSLLEMILHVMRQDVVGALTFLVMFGSPHLFGLAVAIAHFMRDERAALFVIQIPLVVLQGMVFLVGAGLLGAPVLVGAISFIGFALITGVYYVYASGEAAAAERVLSVTWHVRWGALLVAGVGMFLRVQAIHLGVAIDAALLAAALLLGLTARHRPPAVDEL